LPLRSNTAASFEGAATKRTILFHVRPCGGEQETQKNKNIMTIQRIIGENGELPKLCGRSACPAAIIAENGDLFVQGYNPAADESAQLTAPTGESFVRMPRAVFEKIARQVLSA
jgi:hypothetical protein